MPKFIPCLSLILAASVSTLCGLPASAANNAPVTVTIDASKSNLTSLPTAISPLIYGDNGNNYSSYDSTANFPPTTRTTTIKLPILRLGGDLFSTYNWQIDAQNHDFTLQFESLSCANSTTSSSTMTTNGQLVDSFIKYCQNTGASPMITIPFFPYLANLSQGRGELDSYPVNAVTGNLLDGTAFSQAGFGAQYAEDGNAGDGRDLNKNELTITPGSNTPSYIDYIPYVENTPEIQQNFLIHLTSTYGTAANGGVKYYILDNEPGDWFATHFDAYPTGIHTADYLMRSGYIAQLIKSEDPTALVVGPEDTAWSTYFVSGYDDQHNGDGTDLFDPNGQNGTYYYPYILSQYQQMSTNAGMRLLDYLSCHYYAQSGDVSGDSNTTADQNLRNQSTRELWDPNYASPYVPNVATYDYGYAPQLIPLMKGWINNGYPGTKFAITEYSFGDDPQINGATTEADVLGIFGVYGVDLATRFGDQSYSSSVDSKLSFSDKAIQMYTNYDSNGAHFGDMTIYDSVPDTEPNPTVTYTGRDNFASYAAKRTSDGALTVMVINKVLTGSTPVTLNLSNFAPGTTAQVWQLSTANSKAITQMTNLSLTGSTLSATVPAQSVTLYVIPPAPTKQRQSIKFDQIPDQAFSPTPLTLTASATSGLPITYSVAGPAKISGDQLTFNGTGTVSVRARQDGNATYNAATSVRQSFQVTKASQTLVFHSIPEQKYTHPHSRVKLEATASSGLPITFTVTDGPGQVDRDVLISTGVGVITVVASQAGNGDYEAAPSFTHHVRVEKGD